MSIFFAAIWTYCVWASAITRPLPPYGRTTFQAGPGYRPDALGRAAAAATERGRLWAYPGHQPKFANHAQAAQGPEHRLPEGLVPLDVDVFPQDNSNTKKEVVSRTYKNYDGYAPMPAYLGKEGWRLEVEFQPGSQHSQNGFVDFITRMIADVKELTKQPLLVRAGSGNDAQGTLVALEEPRTPTTSSNGILGAAAMSSPGATECLPGGRSRRPDQASGSAPRSSRSARRTTRNRIPSNASFGTEWTIDRNGQFLLAPDVALEGWWTDLVMEPEEVIELYRQHATSEQFHCEFKTDLDLERLPSGKFATNALVMMALGVFAYNILRFIGQMGLIAPFGPVRHSAKRRQLRTVIQELMYLAGRLITTGRQLKLRFSRHCPAFTAFSVVYARLAPGI